MMPLAVLPACTNLLKGEEQVSFRFKYVLFEKRLVNCLKLKNLTLNSI